MSLLAPGRPMEARVDEAVREAVVELLAERGYAGMTVGQVAARARVGRGALYRRWNSKAEMVFASVVHPVELGDPPDTGSLRGDLRRLARIVHARVSEPSATAALTGLGVELRADPTLVAALDERVFGEERRWIEIILGRAHTRDELVRSADPELVRRLLVGAITFAALYQPGMALDSDDTADLIARGLGR